MRTIIGSSGRDYVLIILFQFYGSKAELFESNLIWVGQNDPTLSALPPPPSTFILEELIQYYNLMQFLSNQSKLTPNQKNCWYYVIDTKISLRLSECMNSSYLFGFNYFCHFLDFLSLLATKKLIFFVGSKGKKKNLTKIAKIEEIKIHIFCETEKFSGKI